MTKGTYRIRQNCGGRFKRKKGLKRVHELLKIMRRQGISRISVVEKKVETAEERLELPFYVDPNHTYWELTFIEEGTDEH